MIDRLRYGLVAAGIFLAAAAAPATAGAYVYLAPSQCANGASWSQKSLPVDYYINQSGSSDVSNFSALRTSVEESFSTWERPCCSDFAASYAGTTSLSALDSPSTRRNRVVVSWRETNWPAQLGHPYKTVAVTQPRYNGCKIIDATLVFNGTSHTFTTSRTSSSSALEIQNVATHEVGHLLGLGHSSASKATMGPKYHDQMSTLSNDDVNGACSLYGPGTCGCTYDTECPGDWVCRGGTCAAPPCTSDATCAGGEVCDTATGQCEVATCGDDSTCPNDYVCGDDGMCRPECTVCRSCSTRADCGPNGVCADLGGRGRCISQCGSDGQCPGDSECFPVRSSSGSVYSICLNPGAGSGNASDICPASYSCSVGGGATGGDAGGDVGTDAGPDASYADTGIPDDARAGNCPSLGNSCSATNASSCGADANGCMLLASGRQICTCSCKMDRDCGPGNSCVTLVNGSWCFPNEMENKESPCADVSCGTGEVCRDGRCVEPTKPKMDTQPDAGPSTADTAIVEVTPNDPGGCSTSGDSTPAAPLLWLIGLVAWLGRRRLDP